MLTIADTLDADHVRLNLAAPTRGDAVRQVAELLRDDVGVLDWETLHAALQAHPPCQVDEEDCFAICIPHARTDAVSEMVMSAGRFATETDFPGCAQPVRYVFCIGVPQEMASDYLRIVGALMRIFTDHETEHSLHAATTGEAFVAALSLLETKL